MSALRVGIIGLGLMGAPMAQNIAAAGWDVKGWSRRPEATAAVIGIEPVEHPEQLADVDVLLSVLPDVPHLEKVLSTGLLERISGRTTLVICSTSSPDAVRNLATRLAPHGVSVVDAPVSGGQVKASEATLAIMVGGDVDDVEVVVPVLSACGKPVHLGPVGSGQIAKACNQMIVAATTAALVEAAVLAERSDLDLAGLFDLLGTGMAASEVLNQKAARLINHDYTVSGPAKYVVKDLGFALAQAEIVKTELQLTERLNQIFIAMSDAGYGELDISALQAYVDALSPQHP